MKAPAPFPSPNTQDSRPISAEDFFEVFLEELKQHESLQTYYKFHHNPRSFNFRKAYFLQRLKYIERNITSKELPIWDIGCGYGTSAIFLALNGFKVEGSTLEFYFKEIPQRIKFWSQCGDLSGFTYNYANLFDSVVRENSYSYILVQDTLHHLEPIDEALRICKKALSPNGKLIAVEENGNNMIQNFKLFLRRGNNRIITIYDEQLKRDILLGNENIRSLKEWRQLFSVAGLNIEPSSVEYIRLFPPALYGNKTCDEVMEREQAIGKKYKGIRERMFFGLSFCAA